MFQSLTTSVTNERPTLAHILPGEVQKIVKSSKLNPAALVTYEAGPEDQEIAEFLQEFSDLPIKFDREGGYFVGEFDTKGRLASVVVTLKSEPVAYSLVIDNEHEEGLSLPFGSRVVVGPFASEEAAERFAIGLLLRDGVIVRTAEGFLSWNGEVYESDSSFFAEYQDSLGTFEYCHVFPFLSTLA